MTFPYARPRGIINNATIAPTRPSDSRWRIFMKHLASHKDAKASSPQFYVDFSPVKPLMKESIGLNELQAKLKAILLLDGYGEENAESLSFFVARYLLDANDLYMLLSLQHQSSAEEIMDSLHLLFTNLESMREAHKILFHAS